MKIKQTHCETCAYYSYEEDYDDYVCDMNMDEDDWARILEGRASRGCPFYRNGDEYALVRHQI